MVDLAATYAERGYVILPFDPIRADWAKAALGLGREILADPAMRATWLRHGETWFAGVDVLPNDRDGSVAGAPLDTALMGFLGQLGLPCADIHKAQLSVVFPGYPRADPGESSGAVRYRRNRDAAHLDGLHPVGDARRRKLREPHAFILGLPLTENAPGSAPLVVWPGSHRFLGTAIGEALEGVPEPEWPEVDLTEVYTTARREAFERFERVPLHANPGEAILLHRHMLHGIAPWDAGEAGPDRRMVAYFRPCFSGMQSWL